MTSAVPAPSGGPALEGPERAAVSAVERARFRSLVQSPLRAALLRHLHDRPDQVLSLEGLVQALAGIPLDIANCIRELTAHGYAQQLPGEPPGYAALVPREPTSRRLLEGFLATPRPLTAEDRSPAFRRLRELIGVDEKMLVVLESIRTVAKTDISTLILGPTGAGKEVVARVIHELSRRHDRTFQAVSCAALPDSLFESEMFGYEKGAFTGANARKPGKLELANGGTLFLDEVGDLSLVAQAKLLRALEERKVERLGGRQNIDLDFRLVSATNRPLDVIVDDNRFREDLYYRVNAFTVHLPSLRERPADIPILAERFLAAYCAAQGLQPGSRVFSAAALERLGRYTWPGNIRELVATVSRAALSARDATVQADDIRFLHAEKGSGMRDVRAPAVAPLHQVEREHVQRVLETVSWNKKQAARLLEVSREKLYRMIRKYDLAPGPQAGRGAKEGAR